MAGRTKTLEEGLARFWASVDKTRECWIWRGPFRVGGYGNFHLNSKNHCASRWIYEHLHGPVGKLVVDHICNVRKCVNPSHLRAITNKENVLRGIGPTAKHGAKTQCLRGHPFDKTNTQIRPDGRACKKCHNFRQKRLRERKNGQFITRVEKL